MDAAMRTRLHFLKALALAVALALGGAVACAGQHEGPPVDTTLTIWNRTQSELLELRVHDGETYTLAPNLLSAPLPVEEQFAVPFTQGQRVTVIRHRVQDDDPTAYTTAIDLDDVDAAGFTLVVFDRSFRLMKPGE